MLKKILVLNYEMTLLSGLHIGGSADIFDIGGADSTVIKDPLNHQPYIPGSSIKGKLRSLLTMKYGILQQSSSDTDSIRLDDETTLNLFEPAGEEGSIQVSRGIFRDAVLTKESVLELEKYLGKNTFTEIKAENKIDPFKGKAEHPRFIERVPAGARFAGEIVLHIYEGDDEKTMKQKILEGLHLLENSYIGGSGTRGYGRVKISASDFREVL